MPSIKTTTPILGGNYYHIFNRGINRQKIFFTPDNYYYFLSLMIKHLISHMDILAYCLLPNHFHLIVKIKEELDTNSSSTEFAINEALNTKQDQIGKQASKQLMRLFSIYAMAINKQDKRVSSLFDPKFKRLEISKHEYLEYAIFYSHFNPQKHGYSNNFKLYEHSSYKALCSSETTHLNRNLVWDIYGGKDSFSEYHNSLHAEKEEIIME